MTRSRDRSASGSYILAAISCGVFLSSPVFAQQGLSDWQSSGASTAPEANWTSTPPGSYLQQTKAPAKKSSSSSKNSAPPLRTDDFSSDFSSKGQGLSGWQSGSGSSSAGGGQGLSGWQGGSSGGSSSSAGGQGLSGWQSGSSGGSNSSGGGQGLSGWQNGGNNGSGSDGGGQGLSGWQGSSGGSSSASSGQGLSGWQSGNSGGGATLGDVLQQEQSMGGGTQLQGGVERDRTVNNFGNTMGGGMGVDPNAMGGNQMNGTGNAMNGMGGGLTNPMGGMGGALGGMGGAGGLMDVLMNIMPKRPAPGTVGATPGTNQSYFRTKSHTPNMLTGVPKTINRSVNRALNRNLNRGINTAAARATGSALRHIRF